MRSVLKFLVLFYAAFDVAAFAGPYMRRTHPDECVVRQETTTTIRLGMQQQHAENENLRPDVRSPRRTFLATVAASTATLALGMPSIGLADDSEPLHKVDYPVAGKCGQADGVPENAVFFVKNFGGFKDGSCATEGFTVQEGTAKGTGEKDKERTYTIYSK